MPYIHPIDRERFEEPLAQLKRILGEHPGELNYVLSSIIVYWLKRGGMNYQKLALATGVVENVKQEIYRRLGGPYEDKKLNENGDIPGFESE